MNKESRFLSILEKLQAGNASFEEINEFDELLNQEDTEVLIERGNEYLLNIVSASELKTPPAYWDKALEKILNADKGGEDGVEEPAGLIFMFRKYRLLTASILVAVAIGCFFYMLSGRQDKGGAEVAGKEIQSGKNGAILTLSDGRQVLLDTISSGVVAMQGGVAAKVIDGALQYEGNSNEVFFNTMTTPRGRQFKLTLPDRSSVWLNSSSSIRYPTVFAGNERKVFVSGEVFIEVSKNADIPFHVVVDNEADIEVLGTSFNINAYKEEPVFRTTLLEGSIRVALSRSQQKPIQAMLKPGEQLKAPKSGSSGPADSYTIIKDLDLSTVTAWKSGLFNFDGLGLKEVMRQLERWYDIDVVYEGKVPDIELGGEMTRGVSLNGLMIALKKLGVNYRLEGRKLYVFP